MNLHAVLVNSLLAFLVSITILFPGNQEKLLALPTTTLISRDETIQPYPTRIIVRLETQGLNALDGLPSAESVESQIERIDGLDAAVIRQNKDFQVYSFDRPLAPTELQELLELIRGMEGVAEAYEDVLVQAALTPTDSLFERQDRYYGAGPGGLNMIGAWEITTGDPKIRVAILDTGNTEHPDLAGRWLGGYDFVSDPDMSNDGDGWDPDPADPGDGSSAVDSTWHGTHVAGIFGASGNNQEGIAGVNWQSPIVPVRVLGKGGGWITDVVDGMRWAAGLNVYSSSGKPSPPENPYPADILNLSLGVQTSCSSYLQDAINEIVDQTGAMIVVAAGNWNTDTANVEPAGCQNVITVGASDNTLPDKAFYSDYGTAVTVSAPGNGILSTVYQDGTPGYIEKTGTSMAAPHVAGIVSLMLAANSSLEFLDIKNILMRTANPFPLEANLLCQQGLCGTGTVDAYQAVQMAQTYSPPASKSGSPVIQAVFPEQLVGTMDRTVRLVGMNFGENPSGVLLNADTGEALEQLPNIDVVDSIEIQVGIPADLLASGSYEIQLTWAENGTTVSAKSPVISVLEALLPEGYRLNLPVIIK